ncbi:MAG: Glutamine-scyllo-inositol transaminase [Candidatus Daviesbacteria bacterium GW2011_GWA1_41_61]|uniref:Glutamine-scyllo-inositol transaminase n=1 Tax=Candidatus Daviesbacteria bacterium GW2011_GWA2_40_9 TaxID=1618424 RepID=A0A0G0WFC2_9BACT|nr:MAG: Glutamine-scyllo-inositol transaminase [Candidatus Daviesbacteria bacterium GW2011_GWA2_40_9]KKR92921.1 MAG: Glutamine-scyllo-inositol transaminase [Candidatus Daviesbacteria bacterium GW2011_GWB1_41_15]KKS15465.1 MAG: Glutamine-scyllo-inositol transaminase [Candidatus Daviesbacteria bacterium GW2011_GWA1_41_61]
MKIKFNNFQEEVKEYQEEFIAAVEAVLFSGWYILGREVLAFEKEFANYLGAKHCIGVGNGLEALQISLMALGIREGDEVITTPISAVATTLAILAVKARPVFVDTTEDGLIDTNKISQALTKHTKVILPVHLYGNSVELSKILALCKRHKLYLIEDACQAHGSQYRSRKLGTFGDLGCFSFYPTKNLGGLGDGGAIVTNKNKLASLCYQIRDYGQKGKYKHVRYGLNSRLDEIQAAILKVKLKNLDKNNDKREQLALRYMHNLSKFPQIKVIKPPGDSKGNFHLFVIQTRERDQLKLYLEKSDIPVAVHYPLLIPQQLFLKGFYNCQNLPNAKKFVKRILSLPCHPQMTIQQVDYICGKINSFYYNEVG